MTATRRNRLFFIKELFNAIPEGCKDELVTSLPSPEEMEADSKKYTIVKILELKGKIERLPQEEEEEDTFSNRMGSRF